MAALGSTAGSPLDPLAVRSAGGASTKDPLALGPLEKVYMIWLGGASCEGCTVAAVGGTHPRLEQLLVGAIPGLPRVELLHCLVAVESGADWTANLFMAAAGELDAPYILTYEGSVMDESTAGDGYWSGIGQDPDTGRQITSEEWLDRLAPGAAAVIAIGTCATWGGIPAAEGNPTNARGLGEHLGPQFRSAAGVPVMNIPGCAPIGDNFTETAAALLLHLNGLAPLPELDELGRPAWLYADTVHAGCPWVGYYNDGVFATEEGAPTCLVELGCWGPVVQCNIAERGVIDGNGGCMSMGGICIGCTMPGFPDRFARDRHTPELVASAPVPPVASKRDGTFLGRVRGIRERPAGPVAGTWSAPVVDQRPPGTRRRRVSSRFYRRQAASTS